MALINYVTEVRFGAGALAELKEVCDKLGIAKPCIVTDKGVQAAGIVEKVQSVLGQPGTVFNETPSNPSESAVRAGVEALKTGGCDGIVAVGGGSSIDLAKAVAVAARHEGPLRQFADRGRAAAHHCRHAAHSRHSDDRRHGQRSRAWRHHHPRRRAQGRHPLSVCDSQGGDL